MLKKKNPFKRLWKREKILVTSIFSFSHNVFYPSQNKFQLFSRIYFVVCNNFNLTILGICHLVKSKSFKCRTNHKDIFVAFVEDNATTSSILYVENHALYFVQNQFLYDKCVLIAVKYTRVIDNEILK